MNAILLQLHHTARYSTLHTAALSPAAVSSAVCIASPEMLIMQCTKRMRVLLYSAYFLNQEVLYYTIL